MAPALPPLRARLLRHLDLAHAGAGDPAFLSAASGLVRAADQLYVVADDELHLGQFPLQGDGPGSLLRLFAGHLPVQPAARKRLKADLEVLMLLPALPGFPHGALFALGSGSRPTRERAALVRLDADGKTSGAGIVVDAAPLHRQLAHEFGTPNIEGAWLHGTRLRLLQRGNQGGDESAVIDLDFTRIATSLAHELVLPATAPLGITRVKLGDIDGVGLSFTDASGLPDGHWVFSAVAEDTADAYADGRFVGTVIGLATAAGEINWQRRLEPAFKVEGIHAEITAEGLRLLCATDADDRSVPAELLEVRIEAQALPH